MPKITMDVTIVPLGTQTTEISDYVAACLAVVKNHPDVTYRLNPMSTTLEGEFDSLLALVRQMHEAPFNHGAMRVSTTIRIDDRRDQAASSEPSLLEHKVSIVRKKAGL